MLFEGGGQQCSFVERFPSYSGKKLYKHFIQARVPINSKIEFQSRIQRILLKGDPQVPQVVKLARVKASVVPHKGF